MTITLCSSAKFFDRLPAIKKSLETHGHTVLTPSMDDYHNLVEDALAKIQHDLIREHFSKIEKSDAIFVANFEKNEIPGYIGGNVLLEIGLAFYLGLPIYLLNEIPEKIGYREELLAMQPVVIGEDWSKILN